MPDRPQKITFADMRDMGVHGLLIYCSGYKCSHLTTTSGDSCFGSRSMIAGRYSVSPATVIAA